MRHKLKIVFVLTVVFAYMAEPLQYHNTQSACLVTNQSTVHCYKFNFTTVVSSVHVVHTSLGALTPAPGTTHVRMRNMPCASLMAHGWTIESSGQTGMPASRRDGSMVAANLEDR